ncbi:MAG: hypothetical protein J5I99_00590 [Verrucomicrobia bacterium]|nr:hypothetical protein [Verrucomicrobiota bacterium]
MGGAASVVRGVDLSGGRVVAVEGKRKRRAIEYRSAEANSAAPCAAALPIHLAFIRRLTAPLPSIEKARRVLPSLLDIELPFPLESCSHALLHVARTQQGDVEALATAARTDDIAAHLDRLQQAGINPLVLEHEAVALWRQSVEENPLSRQQRRLLICLGEDRTGLMVGSGHGLDTATGLRQSASEILQAQTGGAQRLALWWRTQRERAGAADWHVAWCGPGADKPDLRQTFGALLLGESEYKSITHRDPATLLARGLANGLLSGDSLQGNLRQGALAHPAAEAQTRRAARSRLWTLAAAALLLIAVNLAWLHLLSRERNRWQQRLATEAETVAGTDRLPRGQEMLAAQRALESQAAGWTAFNRARNPGAEQLLAQILRVAKPYGLTFQNLVIRPSSFLLNGTAEDWNDGERLASAFTGDGWQTKLDRSDAGADERVHFSLKGEK